MSTQAPAVPLKSGILQLESTALGAAGWTVMAYGLSQVLRIVNSMVLTRLLAPEAFGLMSLLTTLLVGLTLLSDVGLEEGVIQHAKSGRETLINTAWCVQAIRGSAIWGASVLLAWPASKFYHEPKLLYLLPVVGFGSAVSGLHSINLLSLVQQMDLRRYYLVALVTQVLQILFTLTWAWISPTVWALVAGTLFSYGVKLVISHIPQAVPGKMNRFEWDPAAAKDLFNFGRWIIFGTAAYFFASQADRLFLGKAVTFAQLGVYGIANSLADIPRQVVLMFCSHVGYPFLTSIAKNSREEYRSMFLRYRSYILWLGVVMVAGFVFLGGPLVATMYDHRFRDAVWITPILALGLWHTLLCSTIRPALFALGKTSYNAAGCTGYLLATVSFIPIFFHYWGLRGAVIAIAAADLPLYFVNVWAASKEGISCWKQDVTMTLTFLALLAAGAAIQLLLHA